MVWGVKSIDGYNFDEAADLSAWFTGASSLVHDVCTLQLYTLYESSPNID